MYQDFTYKTPGTFISPPWEKGRRRSENHHGVSSCVVAMFEGLCGGDPFQSQKVSQTNIIT